MNGTNPRYNRTLFLLTCALWAYMLSWVLAPSFWLSLLSLRHHIPLDIGTAMTFFGVSVVLLAAISSIAVVFHLAVVIAPSLRARFRPRFLGHFAAFALLWIAYGTIAKISGAPFPYASTSRQSSPK